MSTAARRRTYELRKRAENVAETRLRITEAVVALHGSIGPARTTVSAIAERAGVQRHTVYRHFPRDEDVFAACTAHFWALHPWPDPQVWATAADPRARLRTALEQLYTFYADIAPMMTNVLRDAEFLPLVAAAAQAYVDFADDVAAALATALAPDHPLVAVAVRHAVDFRTWQSLVGTGGAAAGDAIELVLGLVNAAAATSAAGRG